MIQSLYLHVPFCKSICYYCDFKRTLYNASLADKWLMMIQEEMNHKKINPHLKTIYIGGGTPTSLTYEQLERLLQILRPYSYEVEEFTIESNIESLDEDKIKLLKQYGVNRISLGVQSLQDALLQMMNRKHTKKEVYQKIKQLYDLGITNISVDMIYGFEEQSLQMWEEDLKEITSWKEISHLSLYSLTIEENSVFGKQNKKTQENEIEAKMYDMAIDILKDNGFEQYEIANFAKNNKVSMHNCAYWQYDDFYGIGVGASGKENGVRYENSGTILQYVDKSAKVLKENLDVKDQMFENIMMSLRMRKGLDLNVFKKRYNMDIHDVYKDVIQHEIVKGNLIEEDNFLKVSKQGMFYLHDVLVQFLED